MFFDKQINTSVINVSSKLAAKLSCLQACNNDIDKAQKLYNFIVEDIKDLPDKEINVSKFAAFKNNVNESIVFIKENKDDILGFVDFIKSFKGTKTAVPLDLPDVPKP